MRITKNLFDQTESDEINGIDAKIDSGLSLFYVSENSSVFCYTGILFNNDKGANIDGFPLYFMEMNNKKIRNSIKGFLRIEKGCILLDKFISEEYYNEKKYKKLDYILRLPSGPSTYFGVEKRIEENNSWWFEENAELTRDIFGINYNDLDEILEAYSKVINMYSTYLRYPKITRSNQKDNACDLTGLWIPKGFPYITFQDGDSDFSHVSLWGFYRHICLLMMHSSNSAFYKALMNEGASEKAIKNIIDIDDYFGFGRKVMYNDIINDF